MKNMLYILLILAIAAAYYFYRKATHKNPEPEKKTVINNCPFCGTKNAQITYYEKDGNTVITNVLCGNKSCPQHYKA